MSGNATDWLRILSTADKLNRRVKEPGWIYQDKRSVYDLKDSVIKKLLDMKPDCVDVKLYYVPYIEYSMSTKDKAGQLMRSYPEKLPFEYFLSQVPPTAADREIPEKALVDVAAECLGQSFSFHMPLDVIRSWGIEPEKLERKEWISAPEFNHGLLEKSRQELEELFSELE